jgi:hypothetical protein
MFLILSTRQRHREFRGIVVFDRDVPHTVSRSAPNPGNVQVSQQHREIGIQMADAFEARPGEGELDIGVLEKVVDEALFPTGEASGDRAQVLVPDDEGPFMSLCGLLRPVHKREQSFCHSGVGVPCKPVYPE